MDIYLHPENSANHLSEKYLTPGSLEIVFDDHVYYELRSLVKTKKN
jgi:hypothetical protein